MAPHGNRRAPLVATVRYGTAELRPDPARPQAWTLLVDGVPQSYVDLADPGRLEFDYVRRLATVLRVAAPPLVPLTVLHLGGGGLTLPRLVDHLRPGSRQRVVERDPELLALVRRVLPPPAAVELVVGDAGEQTGREEPQRYDVIVTDVFDGARMPAGVAGVRFATAAARTLRPGGLFAMNLTDLPPLAFSRIQVATARAAFGEVCLLGDPAMLRGRRAGNLVLVAAHEPGTVPVSRLGPGVLHGAELDAFAGGARARLDAPS
jgi:hypothetical protein